MDWPWKNSLRRQAEPQAPQERPRRPVERAADHLEQQLEGQVRNRLICRGLIYDSVVLLDQQGAWLAEVREGPDKKIFRVHLSPFEV